MVEAGYSIRQLSKRRRKQSIKKLAVAAVLFIAPALSYLVLDITGISLFIHVCCWVGAANQAQKGLERLQKAGRASIGAEAEKLVASILSELEREGWKIEYNLPLRYWGDADAFLRSPKGNCFVVDTKGNSGTVIFDGTQLMLRYGRKVYPFDDNKDVLNDVKGQAATLKETYQVRFVTPILCFTKAKLDKRIIGGKVGKIENVLILNHNCLVSTLKKLDR